MERIETTFNMDFQIAEHFGIAAIKDTFKKAFEEWKVDCQYLTELVMVLNHRCWYWWDKGNNKLSELYADMFYTAKDYAEENLKGDELRFFWEVTD